MASGFIAGLVVAFFGAAVGAVIGQFLQYYQQKTQEMESLISTLLWLKDLSNYEVGGRVTDPDSHLAKLYNSLYRGVETNQLFLTPEANKEIREMFKIYASHRTIERDVYLSATERLSNHAENALDEIEEVSWRQCARQFFFSF